MATDSNTRARARSRNSTSGPKDPRIASQVPPRESEPARSADRIVTWYAAHPQLALWVLLLLLPLSAFILGLACGAFAIRRRSDAGAARALKGGNAPSMVVVFMRVEDQADVAEAEVHVPVTGLDQLPTHLPILSRRDGASEPFC